MHQQLTEQLAGALNVGCVFLRASLPCDASVRSSLSFSPTTLEGGSALDVTARLPGRAACWDTLPSLLRSLPHRLPFTPFALISRPLHFSWGRLSRLLCWNCLARGLRSTHTCTRCKNTASVTSPLPMNAALLVLLCPSMRLGCARSFMSEECLKYTADQEWGFWQMLQFSVNTDLCLWLDVDQWQWAALTASSPLYKATFKATLSSVRYMTHLYHNHRVLFL